MSRLGSKIRNRVISWGADRFAKPVFMRACEGFSAGKDERLDSFDRIKPGEDSSVVNKTVHSVLSEILRVSGEVAEVISSGEEGVSPKIVKILRDDRTVVYFDEVNGEGGDEVGSNEEDHLLPILKYILDKVKLVRMELANALDSSFSRGRKNIIAWGLDFARELQVKVLEIEDRSDEYGGDELVQIVRTFLQELATAYVNGRDRGVDVAKTILREE